MAFFRSERGIGRGELAESRLEVPLFAVFMLLCSLALCVFHFAVGEQSVTLALAISMLVFGVTVVRVEFGIYILVISMLLSPEIALDDEFSLQRSLNMRYGDILIVVIFLGVIVKLAFEGRLGLWEPSPINIGIVAYFGVCTLSTLLAFERNLGAWDRRDALFTMLKMLEYYLIFFMVGHAVRTRVMIRNQLALFFFVALIVSGYAIYTIPVEQRVGAPFEAGGTEPNTLGGYLVLVMCAALGLFTQSPNRRYKLLFLVICAIAFFPFLHTLSRASYVSLIVGVTAVSLASRNFLFVAIMALVLATSSLVMPEKVKERVNYTFQSSGESVMVGSREVARVDKSTYERVHVWRKVRFMLGLGPEFFLLGAGVSWQFVLDSQYARVILETGMLGLLAFLFLHYRVWRTTREAYRWTDDWMCRGLGMGLSAAVIALLVHGFGTITFLIMRIMEPYWFLAALMVAARNIALQTHRERAIAAKAAHTRLQSPPPGVPAPNAGPVPAAAAQARLTT